MSEEPWVPRLRFAFPPNWDDRDGEEIPKDVLVAATCVVLALPEDLEVGFEMFPDENGGIDIEWPERNCLITCDEYGTRLLDFTKKRGKAVATLVSPDNWNEVVAIIRGLAR